jgi:hypothetical protein
MAGRLYADVVAGMQSCFHDAANLNPISRNETRKWCMNLPGQFTRNRTNVDAAIGIVGAPRNVLKVSTAKPESLDAFFYPNKTELVSAA